MTKKKTASRKKFLSSFNNTRQSRGALFILAFVFVLSAGARLASGTGAAIAREVGDIVSSDTDNTNIGQPAASEETIKILLDDLMAREKILADKEKVMARKMKAYEIARIEIEKNMTALEDAEQRLSATMTVAQTAAEDDLVKLTAVYENMKPKEAAALFEQMAPDFAAGFLSRMRSDAAAPVMAGLTPETAYSISVILAGRNANAPSK